MGIAFAISSPINATQVGKLALSNLVISDWQAPGIQSRVSCQEKLPEGPVCRSPV